MKTIRIGNDIQVNWYITRFGQPEDFSNKNLSIDLIDKFNNKQVFDYSIDGNKISGIFYGKNQKTNGVYRLLLIENEGDTDMVTLDYIDCFCLSNKLKNQTSIGTDTTSSINTEVIELNSEITTTPDLTSYAKKEYVDDKVLILENEISANTEYIDTLSGNVNTINENVNAISGNVNTINENVNTISGNVNTLSGNVNTISGNVNTINNKVNTISGNVNTISGNVNTISGNVNNIQSQLANKADLVNGTVPTNELPFATITTNGSIKLYNANGINRSGLLLQEDGGLLVNTSQDKGLYRDGVGQLHANIKGAATDEEIEEGTVTNKALTPSNIEKIIAEVTDSIMPEVGPDAAGREYVDLGLPSGTLWATMNVGATNNTDTGLYFQWGDTQGYTADQVGRGEGQKAFSWNDYKWADGNGSIITKYNNTDGKTTLDLEDDAVAANWGGDWHMPTDGQYQELLDNTDKSWTTVNNVSGYKFTSKTDNSKYIFIPTAGCAINGNISLVNSDGYIWSSSLHIYNYNVKYGRILRFSSSSVNVDNSIRNCGLSVRGVLGAGETPSKLHKVAVTGDYNDLDNKPTPTTIEGAATDEEIDAKTSAIKALTPSNIDKLKTVFTSEITTALNQINQRLASLEEIYNGISVGDY